MFTVLVTFGSHFVSQYVYLDPTEESNLGLNKLASLIVLLNEAQVKP
jgi:hypothetical protein